MTGMHDTENETSKDSHFHHTPLIIFWILSYPIKHVEVYVCTGILVTAVVVQLQERRGLANMFAVNFSSITLSLAPSRSTVPITGNLTNECE